MTAPQPLPPPPSWAPHIDAHLAHLRAGGRPTTTLGLRRYQLVRAARALGPNPWSVTTADIEAWAATQDWSNETRRSFRSALRGFYRWAVAAGLADHDPAAALPSVRPSEPAPHPASQSAWTSALLAADPRALLMVRLAGELGMRRGEVAQVHANDVVDDLLGWSLRVHGKGGKIRVLPMPDDLAREVQRACRAGGGYAFPGRINGHLSAPRVGRIVSGLLPEGVSMHALRHRFATLAHGVDHDLLVVQALLGHASVETTRRYVLTDPAALRRTIQAVRGGAAGRGRGRAA